MAQPSFYSTGYLETYITVQIPNRIDVRFIVVSTTMVVHHRRSNMIIASFQLHLLETAVPQKSN